MTEPLTNKNPPIQVSPFSFQPPAGGDVTLRSSDGVTFVVHSLLLGLASKVFSDMLITPTTADVVELAEDAEAISLMLAFMYPVVRPAIDTIHLLEKIMHLAHKYDIDILAKTLVQTLDQQREVIRKDPLRVFRLAKECDFRQTQTLAAKLVTQSHYNLLSPDGLVQFAREFPQSSHVIGIVGAQGVRAKSLEFLSSGSSIIWPKLDSTLLFQNSNYMVCYNCWNNTASADRYRPGWLLVWSGRLHSALTKKLLDECTSYFELSYLAKIRSAGGSCPGCVDQAFLKPSMFQAWARDTRSFVEQSLAPLDVLYAL